MGGILVPSSPELLQELYFVQNATGATLASFDSFLISRGIKTLDLRVRSQSESAMQLAKRLAEDPRIACVMYPGLADHPNHALASSQMNGLYGSMVSFEIDGDFEGARRVANSTRLFQLAVSLGAVESLIEQPASMSHASYAPDDRKRHGINDELIRLSVGLEDIEDLWADLDRALAGG
jgi:cystathionine gamma-lyase